MKMQGAMKHSLKNVIAITGFLLVIGQSARAMEQTLGTFTLPRAEGSKVIIKLLETGVVEITLLEIPRDVEAFQQLEVSKEKILAAKELERDEFVRSCYMDAEQKGAWLIIWRKWNRGAVFSRIIGINYNEKNDSQRIAAITEVVTLEMVKQCVENMGVKRMAIWDIIKVEKREGGFGLKMHVSKLLANGDSVHGIAWYRIANANMVEESE
jgi:hypothetical protein